LQSAHHSAELGPAQDQIDAGRYTLVAVGYFRQRALGAIKVCAYCCALHQQRLHLAPHSLPYGGLIHHFASLPSLPRLTQSCQLPGSAPPPGNAAVVCFAIHNEPLFVTNEFSGYVLPATHTPQYFSGGRSSKDLIRAPSAAFSALSFLT
jgi:hypothetical protein